ncbi:hypothetical protein GPECTOR_88g438 [Gonium pectorale]|uniref:Uncharacterized protein n=1 Tax=Gonium pectorale TaxID=33097 RepID=A0A150G0U2_GONPE|nr:hypothetical protein GPECTOR_88g438 [Gonium pectorale]|eukprot:KXZ43496.1 hypothetical protein GPECTOR_88g438 [Gonium pectorale]
MLAAPRAAARPFTSSRPAARAPICSRRVAVRAAAEDVEVAPEAFEEAMDAGPRGRRVEKGMELKHFLPLPKPAHLVFVKPTVAVVAGVASRSSVGLKMTAGNQQLERYVIEYYARSVK